MIIIMIFLTKSIHNSCSGYTNPTIVFNCHGPVGFHARINRINIYIFFKRFGAIYYDFWIKPTGYRLLNSKELYITARPWANMSDFMRINGAIFISEIGRPHPERLCP